MFADYLSDRKYNGSSLHNYKQKKVAIEEFKNEERRNERLFKKIINSH